MFDVRMPELIVILINGLPRDLQSFGRFYDCVRFLSRHGGSLSTSLVIIKHKSGKFPYKNRVFT